MPNKSSSENFAEPVLLCEVSNSVATVTLNRPEKFNTLNEELLSALQAKFDTLANDESVRVVVLAATGKAYCAGHDLREMRESYDESYYKQLFASCSQFMQTITSIPQPVIARVQGMATAAGCQLVATCDLAVAAESTKFAVSGINLGLFCSTPAVALSRNVSRKRALEMLFTGDFIDAHTAKDWGLINDVVPDDELDARISVLCERICKKPRVAVSTGKQMFYAQLEKQVSDAYTFAGDTMACNMMADDTREGIDAFIEKRTPTWQRKTPDTTDDREN